MKGLRSKLSPKEARAWRHMGDANIRGSILDVPRIRFIVFWGLHWGPPVWGNYYIDLRARGSRVWSFGIRSPRTIPRRFLLGFRVWVLGFRIF